MSYTSKQFLVCDNSSLANFKNWAQAISTAFSSSGWTKTSDSGQVDWTTIASVPTSGNFVYEIWQPADALQTGSTAYYVKVKYGTGSGSPAGPRLQIQIGTGTDGSGNLTGLTTTNYEPGATTTAGSGSATYDCYFSGDTDRIGFMLWRSRGTLDTLAQMFSIERTKATDGTNSSDGVFISSFCAWNNAGSSTGSSGIIFGVASPNATGSRTYIAPTITNQSGAFNNNVPIFPLFPEYGVIGNPLTGIAFAHSADTTEGTVIQTTLYGATRTFLVTKIHSVSSPGNSSQLLRYD